MSKQITIINCGKMSVVFLYKPVLLHIENLSSSSVFGQHLMDAWLPNVNSDKLVVNKVFARFSLLYIKPFLWCLLHKFSWPQKICLFFMGRSWHPVFSFTQILGFIIIAHEKKNEFEKHWGYLNNLNSLQWSIKSQTSLKQIED